MTCKGLVVVVLTFVAALVSIDARGAGECAMSCNDLRTEVLTLEICRLADKSLWECKGKRRQERLDTRGCRLPS